MIRVRDGHITIPVGPPRFHRRALSPDHLDRLLGDGADGPVLQEAFRAAIAPFASAGLPWSAGGKRLVFLRRQTVVKLPLSLAGVEANTCERRAFRQTIAGRAYCPMAACRIQHNADGIPILTMRLVAPALSSRGLPEWTNAVDCGQVGLDGRGRLVAYDL